MIWGLCGSLGLLRLTSNHTVRRENTLHDATNGLARFTGRSKEGIIGATYRIMTIIS